MRSLPGDMRSLGGTGRLTVGLFLALLTGFIPGALLGYMTSYDRFADYPSPAVSALATTASGLLVTLVVVPLVLGFLATWTARQVGQASNSAGCFGVFVLTVVLAVVGWLVGYSATYER